MTTDTLPHAFTPREFELLLDALKLAPRQSHQALTLWPLIGAPGKVIHSPSWPTPDAADRTQTYIALADAIEAGTLHISELSEHGSVPHVCADNSGDVAVLVLFGEELRGAKQNRIANASFLVGAHSRVVLDVSCVEAGRWARRSDAFAASGSVFSSASRRKMARRVADARADGRGFVANQSEVWEEVEVKLRQSGTASATRAYADHLLARHLELSEGERVFQPVAGQLGFVAAIGEHIAGVEIVGRPEVFARNARALIGAYQVDAVDRDPGGGGRLRGWSAPRTPHRRIQTGRFDSPEAFLRAVARAPARVSASIGLGEDVRLRGHGIEGCALFAGGLVHLTAFPDAMLG